MSDILVPFINCLLVLDSDGDRIIAKYYLNKTKNEQIKFENGLHKKTKGMTFRSDADILLYESEIVVIKGSSDCKIAISGGSDENEIILVNVLDAIYDTILTLLRGQLDKRTVLDNLELVLLTIDEVIDHGCIMELDSSSISSRVLMKGSAENIPSASSSSPATTATGDMTIAQALGLARTQFFKSLTSAGS